MTTTTTLSHCSRMWVTLVFLADQIYWQKKWLNIHPESEFIFSVCADLSLARDHWEEQQTLFYFVSLILCRYCWLIFIQAHSLAIFLDPYYFESNDSGLLSSTIISSMNSFFGTGLGTQKSSLIFFTGLLNPSLPAWNLSYYDTGSATHLHWEYLLDHWHWQRWQLCGIV